MAWLKLHLVTFKLEEGDKMQTEEVQASIREDARIRIKKKYGKIVILKVEKI